MGEAWTSSVRQSGQLTVFPDSSVTGPWQALFRDALRDFNALSQRHGLGVTLAQSSAAPTDSGGANVRFSVGSGAVSATYARVERRGVLDGNRMHGKTLLFSIEGSGIEKAFVFVPSTPQINTPRGLRPVGDPVKHLIAVHELVHACGLHDSDHTTDDLFQASPDVDYGATAARDRIAIRTRAGTRYMPPLVMGNTTVTKVTQLWS